MGRPLNKKFFGNRNPGLDGDFGANNEAGDAGLTGTGIDAIEIDYPGDGWTVQPTYVVEAPSMANGTTLEVLPHYQAISFATTANGTGYKVGDVLETNTGTASIKARAPVESILTVGTPSITDGGTMYDITNGTVGDLVTFTHANLSVALRVRITAVDVSTATAIAVEQAGIWTGAGAAPTSMADGVGGFTATTTARAGGDNNGTGLVLGFAASNWGVYSFGAVSRAGDYTVFPATGPSGFLSSVSPATGGGAKADITLNMLRFDVVNPGNGYVPVSGTPDPEDAYAATFGPLINFTPDNGATYNTYGHASRADISGVSRGIFVYGYNPIDIGPIVPFVPVDIIKQVSSRRYRIRERQFAYLGSNDYGTLTATNTTGTFTISNAQPAGTFAVGSYVAIYGTLGGAGAISGYYPGHIYEIVATNGTSTFKLKDFEDVLTTTAGTITGLTIISAEAPSRPLIVRSAKLVPHWPEAPDEIAILAMDNTSSMYYVTKLTARRAQLHRIDLPVFNDNWRFEDGQSAPWTIDVEKLDTANGTNVWIQNFDILTGP
jgi:hypothetical protein